MKKTLERFGKAAAFAVLAAAAVPPLTAGEDALTIIREVDRRQRVDTSLTRTAMRIYPDGGNETEYRDFVIEGYERGDSESYREVLEPRSVKGLKILSVGDDAWLFFPSSGRVRKIAGASRGESVQGIGGDFSYEDLGGGRFEEKYEFRILASEPRSWTLEGTPRKPDGVYSRLVIRVAREGYRTESIEYHTAKDGRLKTLEFLEYRTLGGRDTATRLVMSNHRKGSRTVVTILSASYGVSVPEKLFNPTQFYK